MTSLAVIPDRQNLKLKDPPRRGCYFEGVGIAVTEQLRVREGTKPTDLVIQDRLRFVRYSISVIHGFSPRHIMRRDNHPGLRHFEFQSGHCLWMWDPFAPFRQIVTEKCLTLPAFRKP
jgi:hypothetical protein